MSDLDRRRVRRAERGDRVSLLGRLLIVGAGAAAARYALRQVRTAPSAPALERVNFRGRTVTLAAGPALAAGAAAAGALGAPGPAARAATLVAGLGGGAVGLYDDVVGARPEQKAAKGFAGHLTALREGRVTAGVVKIFGVGAAGLGAAALLAADPVVAAHPRRRRQGALGRAVDVLLGAGVIAGTANLLNLLDLRPGRALKSGLLLGAPLTRGRHGGIAAGAVGAAAGLLPDDLDEQVMVGDSGANALGAVLGVALAARTGPLGRAGVLAVLAGLTAASEKVSFTQVIQTTPGLRELDALGRRTD
jgi:UDP-N-acetylmuramyl pentapeptide phosphotransferase/UDP-N-acetylglucosamine-1-phosphate transferase